MFRRRIRLTAMGVLLLWAVSSDCVFAQEMSPSPPDESVAQLDLKDLLRAGGVIGAVIGTLSVAMFALIIEHLISIRRRALMPPGLAESVHQHLVRDSITEARQQCKLQPSFLAQVLDSGLEEVDLGYSAVEKSMEDASTEQAARLFRKIEYLSVIGTIAPMLGLLGTVWGMILAFLEFETKANPQVSELAPGIYKALVTTLMGLMVAVPALASFAIFRNRIDELVAEVSLVAERVFAEFKRSPAAQLSRQTTDPEHHSKPRTGSKQRTASPQRIPSVTIEKDTPS